MSGKRPLSVFTLAMINVAAIVGLKNFPMMADYGLEIIFFFFLASLIFFIPTSLVSAELATGWPKKGGIYVWVREALGDRMGLLAIWLLWIENVIWYPTILAFASGTIAYSINPALAENKVFTLVVILISFWGFTFLNFFGMKVAGLVSSIGVIAGTLLPGLVIIVLGILWPWTSHKVHLNLTPAGLVPDMLKPSNLALLTGVILNLAGVEMSAVHTLDVDNPRKSYPKAIFLSVSIIFFLSILGSLSIAVVVPSKEISLISGVMQAFRVFFESYHLGYLLPVIAILTALGALVSVSTWIIGPSKGMLAAGEEGDIPKIFCKANKDGVPTSLLFFQAILVTIFSFVFLFMPNVSSSYWILTVLATQLYLLMYVLMFISAIVLKYKHPKVIRTYTVPGGNLGMWIIAILGCFACFLVIITGFIPPISLDRKNFIFYESFLAGGIILMSAIPFLLPITKKLNKLESE